MINPYSHLPVSAFWRTAVKNNKLPLLTDLYQKKFEILPETTIASGGSCFAQHIAHALRIKGYAILDLEPPPPGLSRKVSARFGYGLYSARYGNIYTVHHLLSLAKESFGNQRTVIWEKEGKYYDAKRPSVEPYGLESAEEVEIHRSQHLKSVRKMFLNADVFVFTFGLTEAWLDAETGDVYPTAPGVVAGSYEETKYFFKNYNYDEILNGFLEFQSLVNSERAKERKKNLNFILTVSPVPLTATASNEHVLVANMNSKSKLRAVAGELALRSNYIAYFPSYEIITSPWSGKNYYSKDNFRDIISTGIDDVMKVFFQSHAIFNEITTRAENKREINEDSFCDEVILDSFCE